MPSHRRTVDAHWHTGTRVDRWAGTARHPSDQSHVRREILLLAARSLIVSDPPLEPGALPALTGERSDPSGSTPGHHPIIRPITRCRLTGGPMGRSIDPPAPPTAPGRAGRAPFVWISILCIKNHLQGARWRRAARGRARAPLALLPCRRQCSGGPRAGAPSDLHRRRSILRAALMP